MENRNIEKGMDIVSKLLAGEQVSETGNNQSYYQEYNNNAEVYDFVHMALKKMNIKLAVCSSSPKDTIVVSLSDMGIIDDFDIICCSEDFEYPKPSPDIYLHAMDKLHVNKENTIVYEDSTIGIKAGVASGALCIAREDKRFNQDQSEAAMMVKDIVELLEFVEKENGRNIEN